MEEVIELVRSTGCDVMAITEAWQIIPEVSVLSPETSPPPIGKSTHLTIQWSPAPSAATHRIKVTRQHCPIPDSAMREFGRWLVEHPWLEVLNVDDVETKWRNYSTTTIEAFHHFFPVKDFSVHHSDAPWMTPHIKRLIKQRNKAFYTDRAQFKFLRNKVIREISTAKSSYYSNKLQHLKQQRNNTQWFSKIKALCGLQGLAAQEINSHFASICQTIPPLDPSCLPAYLPSPSSPIQVQVADVATKLGKLKNNRSTTPSDLPIKIYKEFAPELTLPLSSIINASLSQNTCPSDWKISYVTPIPKTLSPQSLSDLRPITITPIPRLICEDLVFNSVYSNIKDSIDAQQFGNMKSSSTTHSLIDLLNFLHSNLDKRNTSLAVTFVDFRKAFDLVDHNEVNKHSHNSSVSNVEVAKAYTALKRRAVDTIEKPSVVISEILTNVSQVTLGSLPDASAMRKTIKRKRRAVSAPPPTPVDLQELELPHQYKIYIPEEGREENFLIGDSGPGLHRILLFGRESWLQHLQSSDTWYGDGTFKIAPRLFSQVYIILAKKFNGVIPIIYALLPNKQRSTYSKMFEMLKDLEPTLSPTSIICDFEHAAFTAMKEVFPEVEIKGCFFPFITKYAQKDNRHGLHFYV
ncbi:uncharacterized protein LOC143024139 [Oratosquilla oratoria]|uniref:uncharacterized protein LOC143024139 n=1 Tax=Oratosquilla oratoria TaxID=337810 RepID=UPI003F773F77